MFTRLPESNAKRQRRTGGFVVSTLAHGVLIALAVRATGLTAAPAPKTEVVPTVYIVPPPSRPTPPSPVMRSNSSSSATSVPTPPFPPVITTEIPSIIPEPGVMAPALERLFERSGPVAAPPAASPNAAGGAPVREDAVEKAVVALPGSAQPRYPSMLQSAGLEGDVRAQFVVDTLGRVEQGSVRVLETTHEMFATSVRDALVRARFRPAEAGGHKVRQLVEQTFTFRIAR